MFGSGGGRDVVMDFKEGDVLEIQRNINGLRIHDADDLMSRIGVRMTTISAAMANHGQAATRCWTLAVLGDADMAKYGAEIRERFPNAILAINPRASLSQIGAALWIAGVVVQLIIVARWLGRPPSGAPIAERKPTRVPARV